MIHRTSVRLTGAGLGAAALGFGLPVLVGAGAGTASAQTAPATCASAPASPAATATATTSPTPVTTPPAATTTATPTASATPTSTTTPCPTAVPISTAPSATATATPTATATSTPSATSTVTPPAPVQCVNPAGITLNRTFITPGVPVRVTVDAPAGAEVELQAYSRPSTQYRQVRRTTVGQTGQVTFDVVPGTNTRLFAQCVGQTRSASASKVINVRTALSLTVKRNGRRDYTFQGRILPRRAGQLITLYRVERDGTRVLTSQLKTDATGTYRINRRFTGSGTFGFLTRTGQTLTNAAGESGTPQTAAGVNAGRGKPRPTAIF